MIVASRWDVRPRAQYSSGLILAPFWNIVVGRSQIPSAFCTIWTISSSWPAHKVPCAMCERFGVPVADDKTIGPVTSIEYLGLVINSTSFEVQVPVEKVRTLQADIAKIIGCEKSVPPLVAVINRQAQFRDPRQSFLAASHRPDQRGVSASSQSQNNRRRARGFTSVACLSKRVSTGHLVSPRILSPASPRILLLRDVFLLSDKIRGDAGSCE